MGIDEEVELIEREHKGEFMQTNNFQNYVFEQVCLIYYLAIKHHNINHIDQEATSYSNNYAPTFRKRYWTGE